MKKKKRNVSFEIDEKLYRLLKKRALNEQTTMSTIARQMLSTGLLE